MAWTVVENGGNCEGDKPWAVIDDETDEQDSCQASEADASTRVDELKAEDAGVPPGAAAGGGAAFVTVLALQEVLTSDGRILSENMDHRTLPIPLYAKFESSHGVDMPAGSQFAGRIEEIEVIDRRIWARGHYDASDAGREAQRHAEDQMMRWVSVDIGNADVEWMVDPEGAEVMRFDNYEIMGATQVGFPAFEDAVIWLDGAVEPKQASTKLPDPPELTEDDEPDLLDILLGSAGIPAVPPRAWFNQPTDRELIEAGGCYVTDEGRLYGRIVVEGQCLVGSPPGQCLTADGATYEAFLLNQLPTTDGRVRTGPLLFAPDHAPTKRPTGEFVNAADAMAYYANVGVGVADVTVGMTTLSDLPGYPGRRLVAWYSGALRPHITAEDLRVLHGSCVSGDWRPMGGRSSMISLIAVNTPGFPQFLQSVDADGEVMAVVASAAGGGVPHVRRAATACGCGGASAAPDYAAQFAAVLRRLDGIDAALAPQRREVIAEMEASLRP